MVERIPDQCSEQLFVIHDGSLKVTFSEATDWATR